MAPQDELPHVGSVSHSHKRQRRRTLIIGSVVALCVLAGLGWLAWHLTHPDDAASGGGRPGSGGGRRNAPATTVGVAVAERADIPVTLDALGTVTPTATAIVRAQVSGVLQQVLYREGQMVHAGQLLATIDPRQFEMALMQSSGQRLRDEAQLDNARLTLERYRTLLQQDSIAKQDVDTQAALVKQLEGTVTSDRAAEGTARLNLGYSRIVAPISGRIGLRAVDVGNVVNTGDANGIATVTQLSPIDVQFSIPQDRVSDIQASVTKGTVLPAIALDRTRVATLDTGNFSTLDNLVDTQTGTVRAKARFPNLKAALFPSQFVNIRLTMRQIGGAIVVPVTALRHGANGDFVYVLNAADRTVSLRPVTRGETTVDKVQIATGLQAGEKVITEGADRLKDGAPVILPGDKPTAGPVGDKRGGGRGRWGGGNRPGASADAAAASASASSASAADDASSQHRHRRRPADAPAP